MRGRCDVYVSSMLGHIMLARSFRKCVLYAGILRCEQFKSKFCARPGSAHGGSHHGGSLHGSCHGSGRMSGLLAGSLDRSVAGGDHFSRHLDPVVEAS